MGLVVEEKIRKLNMSKKNEFIIWFQDLSSRDVAIAGGKNASLGEMIRELKTEGIDVPEGFAVTAKAYREFVKDNDLKNKISENLEKWTKEELSLEKAGKVYWE